MDAAELSALADQLRDELKKMNSNVLSLDVIRKTEKVENWPGKSRKKPMGTKDSAMKRAAQFSWVRGLFLFLGLLLMLALLTPAPTLPQSSQTPPPPATYQAGEPAVIRIRPMPMM